MQAFAALLERLVLTPQRNVKLRLLTDYFRATPDPDRGYALAALTGDLDVRSVKPAMLRALAAERVDEVLFAYSYDYVGDLAETISLTWPGGGGRPPPPRGGGGGGRAGGGGGHEKNEESTPTGRASPVHRPPPGGGEAATRPSESPRLGEVVERLQAASRSDGPRLVAGWLDALDAAGRWALIKLVVGGLRIGVSARLAKQALADLGGKPANQIAATGPGLPPPYAAL